MNTISKLIVVLAACLVSACTTPPKEHTAPCKRPANALSYAQDPRTDCGSMQAVNNAEQAMAEILTTGTE